MKTDWDYVEFYCDAQHNLKTVMHICSHRHPKRWYKLMKFSTKIDQPENVYRVLIELAPFDRIISGVGEVFPNLLHLTIREQDINELKADNFAYMEKVKHLDLASNKIKNLKENVFEHLHNLEWLKLSNNQLEKLPPKLFYNQQKLKEIDLGYNLLTHLDKGIFAVNSELKKIWLRRNKLKEIDVDFTKLSNIDIVDLFNNDCISLKYGGYTSRFDPEGSTVKSIQEIQKIVNQNCTESSTIDHITDHILIKFDCKYDYNNDLLCSNDNVNLWTKSLKFSTNLEDPSNVTKVEIDFGSYDHIVDGIGEHFPNLQELAVMNNIKFITRNDFANMKSLIKLVLLGNPLRVLDENIFENLEAMEILILSNCKLSN
jgi:hypothetical protein